MPRTALPFVCGVIKLLDFYYSFRRAPLAKYVRVAPSARAAPPILGAVADWVRVVLASGPTVFRAQKQHLGSSVS